MTAARVQAPIVLVHGLLGFDALRVWGRPVVSYFPGIEEALRAAGNSVYTASLSPTAGVARRALELRNYLNRELPRQNVHIFAHSMGGLDARFMITRLGMHDRVLSLTTIGTPHRGTPFADWGIRHLSAMVKPMFQLLDVPHEAFYDLTTATCRAFNADVPDVPQVRYFSVAGRCFGPWLGMEWLFPHTVIALKEGANDGMVSVASASYGEATDVWDGDHLSLINWPNPQAKMRGVWQERARQYVGLAQRLVESGF